MVLQAGSKTTELLVDYNLCMPPRAARTGWITRVRLSGSESKKYTPDTDF
jgi:hypothetical protein